MIKQKKSHSARSPRTAVLGGSVVFRTKPMAQVDAESFARMISRNARFDTVCLNRCRNSDRCFVSYAPAYDTRKETLLSSLQEEQKTKGADVGSEYTWTNLQFDSSKLARATVINPKTGREYLVTAETCDCPQFQYRLRQLGMTCKHSVAFGEFAASQRLPEAPW